MMSKTCSKCKAEKVLAEFYKEMAGLYGVRGDCKVCSRARKNTWRAANAEEAREKRKEAYWKNPEKERASKKRWYSSNPDYHKNKTQINPIYKLVHNSRRRINHALTGQGFSKKAKTKEILGCTFQELKAHIEKQFQEGMTWNKVGPEIHIDHIIPLASAKTEDEVIRLCHYTNLQPLWAKDNLAKGSKVI